MRDKKKKEMRQENKKELKFNVSIVIRISKIVMIIVVPEFWSQHCFEINLIANTIKLMIIFIYSEILPN